MAPGEGFALVPYGHVRFCESCALCVADFDSGSLAIPALIGLANDALYTCRHRWDILSVCTAVDTYFALNSSVYCTTVHFVYVYLCSCILMALLMFALKGKYRKF